MTCSADVDRRNQNVPRALALLNIRVTGRAVQQAMRTVMKFPVRKPTLRDVGRNYLPIGQRCIRLDGNNGIHPSPRNRTVGVDAAVRSPRLFRLRRKLLAPDLSTAFVNRVESRDAPELVAWAHFSPRVPQQTRLPSVLLACMFQSGTPARCRAFRAGRSDLENVRDRTTTDDIHGNGVQTKSVS